MNKNRPDKSDMIILESKGGVISFFMLQGELLANKYQMPGV